MADQTNLLCEEKHKYIDDKLNTHDLQISANTEDINLLKSTTVRTETIVGNLSDQIKELVIEMKEQRKARTDTLLALADLGKARDNQLSNLSGEESAIKPLYYDKFYI